MVMRSKKRQFLRLMTLVSFLCASITYLLFSRDDNALSTPNLNRHLGRKDEGDLYSLVQVVPQKAKFKDRRKNIIIVAHGRSGSTITGDMFNHHPSVFYLHEPLQTVERISRRKNLTYGTLMTDVLTNILRCNFSKTVTEDIKFFYHESNNLRASYALGSPPLCPYEITDEKWDPKLCYPFTGDLLGNVCKNNYKVTVVKILMSRIAGKSIKTILAACSPSDIDCQVIFLIRDPRAVIMSSRSVNFFRDPATDESRNYLRSFSYEGCSQTEENLRFVKNLPHFWRKRIMIQRYEDFAVNPLKAMSRLYEFSGLPVLERLKLWLLQRTNPSGFEEARKECVGSHPALCTVDDSKKAINRWRWKVPFVDIDIVEHYCKHVMDMMGYTLIDRSFALMHNISIPLFSEKFESEGWLVDSQDWNFTLFPIEKNYTPSSIFTWNY